MASGIAVVGVVLAGVTFEALMRFEAPRRYPAPGRLVNIGGRRIQIDCRGSGSPTVVLESGLDDYGSLSWAAVHDPIATTTRVCAYSRAGIMWSDRSDVGFDARQVALDLHAALEAAGERAPWVLVGHSIGGPYLTVFTDIYPSEVGGLVFVDPSHPDQFSRYNAVTGRRMEPNPRIAGRHHQLGDRPAIVLTAMAPKSAAELALNGITAAQGAGNADCIEGVA